MRDLTHHRVEDDKDDGVPDHGGLGHLVRQEGSQGGDVVRQSWSTLSSPQHPLNLRDELMLLTRGISSVFMGC